MSLVMVADSSSGKVTGKLPELLEFRLSLKPMKFESLSQKPSHYHVLTVLLDIQDGRPLPSFVVILPLTSPQSLLRTTDLGRGGEPGEIAQYLGALVALAEALDLDPSIHVVACNHP